MELYPAGNYQAKPIAAEWQEHKDGTDIVIITWELPDGQTRRQWFYHCGGATPISERTLASIGWNGGFGDQAKFSKEKVSVYCKHEPYGDKMQEKWNVSGFGGKPIAQDRAIRFQAKYRVANGVVAKPSGGPPTPPSQAKGPPQATGDVTRTFDKDAAWAQWVQVYKGEDKVPTDTWFAAIKKAGKDEDKFTAAQWQKVAEAAVPF